MTNDSLTHYGIPGMKWGRRKGSSSKTSKSSGSSKKSSPRRMSNKELNSRIKRLRMEQELDRLTKSTTKKVDVKKIVMGTTAIVAGTAALTGNALTIYNNLQKMNNIVKKR